MSGLKRLFNPFQTANFELAASGRELFGTVIKAGVNRKTVTVKVDRFFRAYKINKIYSNPKPFQAHDEEEYCKVGDKVVIRSCRPISKLKHYYVRNVVFAVARDLPPEVKKVEAEVNKVEAEAQTEAKK